MTLSGKLGFRIFTDFPRAAPDLVKRFEGIATSNLADAMGRFNHGCRDAIEERKSILW